MNNTKNKKRPIGVIFLGGWLILQGVVALGYSSQIQVWAYLIAIILVMLGIGILRLHKEAAVATLLLSIFVLIWSLVNALINLSVQDGESYLAGIIIPIVIILYLSRQKVRTYFFDKKPEVNK